MLFFFTHYLHITQALDEGAALALAAELDEKGEAMVGGFKILKDMVTIKKVSKGLKRSGSCSSMASSTGTSTTGGGALSRSGSALSLSSAVSSAVSASGALSRNGSAISLSSVDSGDSMPAALIQKAPFKPDPEVVKAALARVGAAGAAVSAVVNAVKAEGGDVKNDERVVAATQEMLSAKAALAEAKTGKIA